MTQEQRESIIKEAWGKWEEDQKTNPTIINPHAFKYGYLNAAYHYLPLLEAEREKVRRLVEGLGMFTDYPEEDIKGWIESGKPVTITVLASAFEAAQLIREYKTTVS